MKVTPISPNEIKINKVFPDEVISSVNELIVKNAGKYGDCIISNFKQKDLVELILRKNENLTFNYLMTYNFLDIEPVFEDCGWKVTYEKPSIGENHFDPFFKFESKA